MTRFLEIKCLAEEEQRKIEEEIERRIQKKISAGLLAEREVREIEEMRLKPLPDILDIQSVYEDHLFRKK